MLSGKFAKKKNFERALRIASAACHSSATNRDKFSTFTAGMRSAAMDVEPKSVSSLNN